MNLDDLLARCAASILDDKKHGLTYRTCRAEDFEALVELARMAVEVRQFMQWGKWEDLDRARWCRRFDAIAAGSEKEKPDA